ncbi:MAG: hypothetical protein FJ027_04265 [Candidatus Rokubacteria bacterium]|nr:hypothetical protein [Candidatus Rokubacteria bacterium]
MDVLSEVVAGEALPPVADDWVDVAPWFIVDDEFTSVDDWLALTPLDTLWSPLPTFTPGLMFAPALTSVFDTPTFAFTPTFGFTFTPDESTLVFGDALAPPDSVVELWLVDTPWLLVAVLPTSVDCWLADTLLLTLWSPLPTLTPGLTFAPRFTSLLFTPTFAPTPTFGFTLTSGVVVVLVCAAAGAPLSSSAIAATPTVLRCPRIMILPP